MPRTEKTPGGVAHLTCLIEDKLKHLHSLVELYQEHRARAKQWCVTIWMATAVAIATQRHSIPSRIAWVIFLGPICMFWLLEGMYDAAIRMFYVYHKQLALRLVADKRDGSQTEDFDIVGGVYRNMSSREKTVALLNGLFITKTVIVFYLSLIILTAALLAAAYGKLP